MSLQEKITKSIDSAVSECLDAIGSHNVQLFVSKEGLVTVGSHVAEYYQGQILEKYNTTLCTEHVYADEFTEDYTARDWVNEKMGEILDEAAGYYGKMEDEN